MEDAVAKETGSNETPEDFKLKNGDDLPAEDYVYRRVVHDLDFRKGNLNPKSVCAHISRPGQAMSVDWSRLRRKPEEMIPEKPKDGWTFAILRANVGAIRSLSPRLSVKYDSIDPDPTGKGGNPAHSLIDDALNGKDVDLRADLFQRFNTIVYNQDPSIIDEENFIREFIRE